MKSKFIAALTCLVLGAFLILGVSRADAQTSDVCVPSPETSEVVVVTPAIPAVPGTPAVPAVTEEQTVPGTPDLWWNWSPNKDQGPFEGPPAFPVDPRGTWQGPHENGGPSQDTYGTFQQGNGHGSWFHREQGTPETAITVVVTPEVPATPGTPAVPEVTRTIVTPAVTCPEVPPVVNPDPEPPVVVPEEPPVVETPPVVEEPVVEEDDPVISTTTKSEPNKTVKIKTHESGEVTREVTHYPKDRKEEGL